MKHLTITLLTILFLGSCSDEPTSKYANAEECAFKESKDCEDKSCAALAYSYCQKSFKGVEELKLALDKTCKEYRAGSCHWDCEKMKPKGRTTKGFNLEHYRASLRYEGCLQNAKVNCSKESIAKRNEFLKSKCN